MNFSLGHQVKLIKNAQDSKKQGVAYRVYVKEPTERQKGKKTNPKL